MLLSNHDFVLSATKKACQEVQEDSRNCNFSQKGENALNNSPDFGRAADGCNNVGQDHLLRKIGEGVLA